MSVVKPSKYLVCPCCGEEGAEANGVDLWFYDGQPLICGCPGWVSVCVDEDPYICIDDSVPCPRCAEEHQADAEYFRSGTRWPGQ